MAGNMLEHGSYSLEVRGRVLVVRARDAWNLETALRYSAEMEKTAASMAGEPWAILSDLTEWGLSTPEVGNEIARQAPMLDALGRTHNAIVARDQGMRQALVAQVLRTASPAVELEFFDNEAAALSWLKTCGFEVMDTD